MKQHLIILSLALALSACITKATAPAPTVNYLNETSPMACMVEVDDAKRMTCLAIVRRTVSWCAPIVEQEQRDFCIAAVARVKGQQ